MQTAPVDVHEPVQRSVKPIEQSGLEELARLAHPEFRNWEAPGHATRARELVAGRT